MNNVNGTDDVLLVTPQPALVSAVEAALTSNGHAWTWATVQSLREMMAQLAAAGPRAVLVDLDLQPEQTLAELERASARYPQARFVALANAIDQQLLLSAMQSGVRHVLLKQRVPQELVALLQRLAGAGSAHALPEGDVYVVLSAGGGCGASTLAVNLADELAAQAGDPSLLIDLDLAYGTLAVMLGVDSKYGLDQVLWRSGTIDAHLVRSTAALHNDALHLLAAPPGNGFALSSPLDQGRLGQLLDAAAHAYRNVVIDAPRVTPDVAAMLAASSTRTLLAMQLTVKDTRVARSMLGTLAQHGVPTDAVVPVVMRYAWRRHMVKLEDVATALGGAKVECVRSDYSATSRAMDLGQALSAAAPRSAVRRDVQDLATRIGARARGRLA